MPANQCTPLHQQSIALGFNCSQTLVQCWQPLAGSLHSQDMNELLGHDITAHKTHEIGGVYAGNKKRGTYDNSCYTNTILLKKKNQSGLQITFFEWSPLWNTILT